MPLRTFLQVRVRSVVYQVRVFRLLPVPDVDVCLTRVVVDAHFLTMWGLVALDVFTGRWRTVSRRPETVSLREVFSSEETSLLWVTV
ncbi:hypothetical protein ACIRJO_28030 [Streptomyces sp. NPDC102394]|uniref:hypothetical protein n=1 Tax=Streptomyces sp. NPDC102394 TaxID=3366167 RepID=UPI003819E60E